MIEAIYINDHTVAQGDVVGHDNKGRTVVFDGLRYVAGYPIRQLMKDFSQNEEGRIN